jgi:hypothetical protein
MSLNDTVCVVEFSYYRGVNNELIVKELAICAPESSKQQVWVLKEPYAKCNLSAVTQKDNKQRRSLSVHYAWSEGDVPYFHLSDILRLITAEYSFVMTFGNEKSLFISTLINRQTYNVEPAFAQFSGLPSQVLVFNTCCMKHTQGNRDLCALTRAVRLGSFAMNHLCNQTPHMKSVPDAIDETDCKKPEKKKQKKVRFSKDVIMDNPDEMEVEDNLSSLMSLLCCK